MICARHLSRLGRRRRRRWHAATEVERPAYDSYKASYRAAD